jgi:hypothetical protein
MATALSQEPCMRRASLGSAGSGTNSSVAVWPAEADGLFAGNASDPLGTPVSPVDLRCGENEEPMGIATLRSVLISAYTLPERGRAFKGGGGLFRGGRWEGARVGVRYTWEMRKRTRVRLKHAERVALRWMLLTAGMLLAVRFVWGWEAGHRVEAVEAELRAKGIRFELVKRNTPEEGNPAVALEKAAGLVTVREEDMAVLYGGFWDQAIEDAKWQDGQKRSIKDVMVRNAPAIQWLDKAVELKGEIVPSPGFDRSYGETRQLADLIEASVIIAHEDGREVDALLGLRRMALISHIDDHGGNVISHLAARAIRGHLAATLERIEPTLRLEDGDGSAREAMSLLKSLQDPYIKESGARNYEQEIAWSVRQQRQELPLNEWWIRPLREDEAGRTMKELEDFVEGMRATDWSTAERLLGARPTPVVDDINVNRMTRAVSHSALMAFERYSMLDFAGQVEADASAVMLAARLYRMKTGSLPRSLLDLVPDYLGKVPVDPFSPGHAELQYRLDADGPTIWSVSVNMTDEDGRIEFDRFGEKLHRFGEQKGQDQPDLVFGAAWRMAKPPGPPVIPPGGPVGR